VQVILESVYGIAYGCQQLRVCTLRGVARNDLLCMGVEAPDADPVDACFQSTADQLGYDLQGLRQTPGRVVPGGIQGAHVATCCGRRVDGTAVFIRLALHGAHVVQLIATAIIGRWVDVDVAGKVQRVVGVVDGHTHVHPHVLQAGSDG